MPRKQPTFAEVYDRFIEAESANKNEEVKLIFEDFF